MKLLTWLKRGIKYVRMGQPIVIHKVVPEIVTLAPNQLLIGRKALITGGTSGIGYAIAKAFLESGATVVITSRSEERAFKTAEDLKIRTKNENVYGVAFDNLCANTMRKSINQIYAIINNNIDILVNNAGIGMGMVDGSEEDEYDTIMETNLKGTYFLSKILAKDMMERGIKGNILNICSSSSLRPAAQPYTLSKWGLRGLTLGMAKSLCRYGITVNGLAPGPTISGMTTKTEDDLYKEDSPIGRWALPTEIANMAVMLVGETGRTIVGDVVYMTGGAGLITYEDMSYDF